ncbi:hypothetical protein C5610_08490 [Idiomarina sp. OT37-5b]|nr:hypothetical protein C5610_08490 [Idiomarina sp. OT37-5b]
MTDWKDQLSQLVYSTDSGKVDPEPQPEQIPEGDGIVRLQRQTKGRKGKGVTIVSGIAAPQQELKSIAKTLKQHCGVGGAVKDYTIELQGDQRDAAEQWLTKRATGLKGRGLRSYSTCNTCPSARHSTLPAKVSINCRPRPNSASSLLSEALPVDAFGLYGARPFELISKLINSSSGK